MRSRLAYTLSFWLIGAVALSVLAMGGIAAWNLRQGFSTYLQTRDFERLEAFVKLLSTHLQQSDRSSYWTSVLLTCQPCCNNWPRRMVSQPEFQLRMN
jgi:hypothetical protein